MNGIRPMGVIFDEIQHVDNVRDFAALGREFNAAVPVFVAQLNEACRPIVDSFVHGVENAARRRQ